MPELFNRLKSLNRRRYLMKHVKRERGQSLVELAISITILVYLLSGVIEFGIAFFQFVQLRDAAQEGALYGSMFPSAFSNIEGRARGASTSPVDLDPDAINPASVEVYIDNTLVWSDGADQGAVGVPSCEGHTVRVLLQYNHRVFMPFIPQFIGRNYIPLRAEVTDTILQPACP